MSVADIVVSSFAEKPVKAPALYCKSRYQIYQVYR